MYAEATGSKDQLLTALEGQVKVLLETAASVQLTVSDAAADLAQTLFQDVEVDIELRQLMDKRRTRVQGFNSIPCVSRSAKLRAPRPSVSDAECCDCCQRVIPETSLARSPLSNGARVCRQCREQHADSIRRLRWPERPTRDRIETLEQGIPGLMTTLQVRENPLNASHDQVATAMQLANDSKRRRINVYRLQRDQTMKGNTAAGLSHQMYKDRVDVDSSYVDSWTMVMRLLVDICNTHQLDVPDAWRDVAVRAENSRVLLVIGIYAVFTTSTRKEDYGALRQAKRIADLAPISQCLILNEATEVPRGKGGERGERARGSSQAFSGTSPRVRPREETENGTAAGRRDVPEEVAGENGAT